MLIIKDLTDLNFMGIPSQGIIILLYTLYYANILAEAFGAMCTIINAWR